MQIGVHAPTGTDEGKINMNILSNAADSSTQNITTIAAAILTEGSAAL